MIKTFDTNEEFNNYMCGTTVKSNDVYVITEHGADCKIYFRTNNLEGNNDFTYLIEGTFTEIPADGQYVMYKDENGNYDIHRFFNGIIPERQYFGLGKNDLVIGNGIVEIGSSAFNNCSASTITVGSSVKKYGMGAFSNTRGCKVIDFRNVNNLYCDDTLIMNGNDLTDIYLGGNWTFAEHKTAPKAAIISVYASTPKTLHLQDIKPNPLPNEYVLSLGGTWTIEIPKGADYSQWKEKITNKEIVWKEV